MTAVVNKDDDDEESSMDARLVMMDPLFAKGKVPKDHAGTEKYCSSIKILLLENE